MLSYAFIQNAFIAGILLGVLLPIVGVSIMYRRIIFISDSLGHINMSGIALGIFLTSIFSFLTPYNDIIVIVWTLLGAMLIEYLRLKYKDYREVSILIVYALSIALTMLFLSLSSGYNASLFNVLFGNINAISRVEVISIAIQTGIILAFIAFNYRKLLLYSLHEEYSKLFKVNTKYMKYISIIIITLTISMAIKIIGVLLVSALISIPLIAAGKISKTLKSTVIYAIVISELSIVFGIVLGYYLNISTSAMIVLVMLLIYVIVLKLDKLKNA